MNWIVFTLLAAFMQAWRNALQARLGQLAPVSAVTLARFLWASPIAAVYLWSVYQWQPAPSPDLNRAVIFFSVGASLMQILATALMVQLFKWNNYAVGAGLAKSEAMATAILGVAFFGTPLTLLGWMGVTVGAIAVFLLSSRGNLRSISLPTVLIGVLCGTSFAITSLWIRQATLATGLAAPHGAAWILVSVITLQTLLMVSYLAIRDPESLASLWRYRKLSLAISLCSCIGSLGWFTAMSLQIVPYVKTLGQVEVLFMMIIGVFWLRQRPRWEDTTGLILIAIAAALVLFADN